ncbi:hypothetical protein BD560DRAFT_442649 [Blakeslea trispora]|nr:hypothetical protein BD560DRAFT_442649 [Blakeslea trispora]
MDIPSYTFEHNHHLNSEGRLPSIKRIFDSINDDSATRSEAMLSQALSPPDLLHDSDEDDADSLYTPSISSSPQHDFISREHDLLHHKHSSYNNYDRRRKSTPYRSPSAAVDTPLGTADKSVVFQLNLTPSLHSNLSNQDLLKTTHQPLVDTCDFECTSQVVCGQSLLSAVRKRVAHARSHLQQQQKQQKQSNLRKRARGISMIEIPRAKHRRYSISSDHDEQDATHSSEESDNDKIHNSATTDAGAMLHSQQNAWTIENRHHYTSVDQINTKPTDAKRTKKSAVNATPTGRPTRVKGPCQACKEASDGCMRKAFNWPFPADQNYSDKGKPFVYLCNKCGLRYNKSNGCVCRHCRWVFCKEEKRKALQHIEDMRRKRPDGFVDPDENIEHFSCNPKYWVCGKPWKVGWVLNSLNEDDDEDALFASLSQKV